MFSLYEYIWQALDLILIPPLIEMCCQYLLPPCNQKHLEASKHRIWNDSVWQQANDALTNLSQFEACFANTIEYIDNLTETQCRAPQIPWMLLHRAVEAQSYEIANWILGYGITEYHPTALAVLDLIINQDYFGTGIRAHTRSIGIDLVLTWRVPLMIPDTCRASFSLNRFRLTSVFQYCLKHYEKADNPLLTTPGLPFDFINHCVQYWLRHRKWSQLIAIMERLEHRKQGLDDQQCSKWFQQFAMIWQALPGHIRPRQWSSQPAVWLHLYQVYLKNTMACSQSCVDDMNEFARSTDFQMTVHLKTLARNHCLATNERIATYLQHHGFEEHFVSLAWCRYIDDIVPILFHGSLSIGGIMLDSDSNMSQSRPRPMVKRFYRHVLGEQDIHSFKQNHQLDFGQFPRRHQRKCIKNPVITHRHWKHRV